MSKREKNTSKINPETKNSIFGVLLIGVTALLILAAAQKAGPVGKFVYLILENLFGWGYYLLPTIAVLVALIFFFSKERIFIATSFIGSALFIITGLGLIDIIFDGKGGIVGRAVGLLQVPFGYTAAIILSLSLMAISLLITFNASIKFRRDEKENGENKEKISPAEIEEVIVAKPEPETKQVTESKEKYKTGTNEEIPIIHPPTSSGEVPTLGVKKSVSKPKIYSNYVAPPLSLFKSSIEKPSPGDLRANANIIKRTLDSFGIPVEMGEINIGPKVTRYTLKPAEGVKLSRITALNPDLSLALAAHPIRIEAPIPGKSLVGIEVPNKSAAIVRLGSLLAYAEAKESGPLNFVLGRGVSGEPIFADIEKMPHLLIAGATGSGKSVAIHSLIISLLCKNSPATLRLALIDPKRVELSIYSGLPHLIAPVIVDGKKTIGLFRWTIQEMERRYEILLGVGARDIGSYNKKMSSSGESPLPYILLVVDELADLMASHGKEIESSVVRLAQMARATGIHLVVSTQRPSVEVITGLIKANITARIALQVASQVDSRTILDMAGAEKLLGGGDMLFISSEFSKPKRIQGAYISEEEIRRVAKFIEENNETLEYGENVPVDGVVKKNGEASSAGGESPSQFLENWTGDEGEEDEMYEEAVRVVSEAKKASASLLQRRLKVGYARAARLLDIMEEKGLIGPGDGAKPREVFINPGENDTV